MVPALHFQSDEFGRKFKNFAEMAEAIEFNRKMVKEATKYKFDNKHNWILDAFGNPVVCFLVSAYGISLFKNNSTRITEFNAWKEFIFNIEKVVNKVSEGYLYCNTCEKWKKQILLVHYGYAGVACTKCYKKNPEFYPELDTRGD